MGGGCLLMILWWSLCTIVREVTLYGAPITGVQGYRGTGGLAPPPKVPTVRQDLADKDAPPHRTETPL